jgi:hypothetical protein
MEFTFQDCSGVQPEQAGDKEDDNDDADNVENVHGYSD